MFPQFFFPGWFSFSLSNLPENKTRHIQHTRAHKSGKRLQLLRDSGGRGQVIRQSGPEQELRLPAADPGWWAAGGQSWLASEELCQPAAALQQVCLQKVLWEKRRLTCWRFWNHYECAAHMSTAPANYYWLYLWYKRSKRDCFFFFFLPFFYDNHFSSLKRSSLWVILACLFYIIFLCSSERHNACVCVCVCALCDCTRGPLKNCFHQSYLLFSSFVVLCLLC